MIDLVHFTIKDASMGKIIVLGGKFQPKVIEARINIGGFLLLSSLNCLESSEPKKVSRVFQFLSTCRRQ